MAYTQSHPHFTCINCFTKTGPKSIYHQQDSWCRGLWWDWRSFCLYIIWAYSFTWRLNTLDIALDTESCVETDVCEICFEGLPNYDLARFMFRRIVRIKGKSSGNSPQARIPATNFDWHGSWNASFGCNMLYIDTLVKFWGPGAQARIKIQNSEPNSTV